MANKLTLLYQEQFLTSYASLMKIPEKVLQHQINFKKKCYAINLYFIILFSNFIGIISNQKMSKMRKIYHHVDGLGQIECYLPIQMQKRTQSSLQIKGKLFNTINFLKAKRFMCFTIVLSAKVILHLCIYLFQKVKIVNLVSSGCALLK